MKFKMSLLQLTNYRAAVRGASLMALVVLGAALVQQARAGCLDVPGVKVPTSDLLSPQSSFGAARFMRADFRQVSDDQYGQSFFHAQIVGLWAFKYTSLGNSKTLGIPDGVPIDGGNTAWFADGNEITFSGMRNPIVGATCIGIWKQTGEYTYVLNHIGLSWNPLAPSTAPAGPGNPGGGPGAVGGPAFIKQHVTLSRDGQTYTGTFSINQLMPDGKTPALPAPIKGLITATRVTVETDTQEP